MKTAKKISLKAILLSKDIFFIIFEFSKFICYNINIVKNNNQTLNYSGVIFMNMELKDQLKAACITFILLSSLTAVIAGICNLIGDDSKFNCYTFTNFADGSPLYIRKDCICTITTVSGDVYIVPTNGNSVRVRESMDEVKKITGIK